MLKGTIKGFIEEEKGQASIEFLLILGAAMVAALIMASSYQKLGYQSVYNYNMTLSNMNDDLCRYVAKALNATFAICP